MKPTKGATRMVPSKNAIPFATSTVTGPVSAKIDRGFRDLQVNYSLRGRLHIGPPAGTGIFGVYVTEEKTANPLAEISGGLKPLLTLKTWAGIDKFLTALGAAVERKFGKAVARKTAAA